MSRTDNTNAARKILQVAEELFAEKGFNGTSVNMIAEKAGVNKALIYYYFKDKNDIIMSLFNKIIKETDEYLGRSSHRETTENKVIDHQESIKKEITFLSKRKKILSVMLMESLKGDDKDYFLFQCAENAINNELETDTHKNRPEMQKHLVHEFFTGFMPIIAFIVFQDKWSDYYRCNPDKALEYFLEAFNKTHLSSHKP